MVPMSIPLRKPPAPLPLPRRRRRARRARRVHVVRKRAVEVVDRRRVLLRDAPLLVDDELEVVRPGQDVDLCGPDFRFGAVGASAREEGQRRVQGGADGRWEEGGRRG